MNCPTRVDPEALPNGWNQNPDHFAAERSSSTNSTANKLKQRFHRIDPQSHSTAEDGDHDEERAAAPKAGGGMGYSEREVDRVMSTGDSANEEDTGMDGHRGGPSAGITSRPPSWPVRAASRVWDVLRKYIRFVGPGWMVSVAYIDPGNYATDVAAGSSYRFRLLVMILVSNIIAIFLQSLCVKLGSVTGLNLAEMCKKHCPPWLNFALFFFAEAGIIATDMAEVIGTAVALNLLLNIPIVAGCAISVLDVLIILIFYNPNGSMRGLRIFEFFVAFLVLGVVVCFAIELSLINVPDLGELFRGYVPSSALIERDGLLQACGILGATVMPHSLYLGSGLVQPRLHEYDLANNNIQQTSSTSSTSTSMSPSSTSISDPTSDKYRPSLPAIRFCLKYSIVDLALSLFTFALFVNSAILIVAGASLSDKDAESASLFGIFHLLSNSIGKAAGIIFALALLLSGISAGIVCTIAGQMVWLGQMQMPVRPWVQRLATRSIAITPSIIVAGAVGKEGVSAALEGTQIALSVILPFVTAPLIWFTCRSKYMRVPVSGGGGGERTGRNSGERIAEDGTVNMRNHWVTACFAVALWLLIVVMNVASWVLQGLGE